MFLMNGNVIVTGKKFFIGIVIIIKTTRKVLRCILFIFSIKFLFVNIHKLDSNEYVALF